MIQDVKTWHWWKAQGQRFARSSPEENMRVFWTSLEMARDARVWPPENPLEGLETDREPARKVNTYVEGEPGKSLDRAEMPDMVIDGRVVPMYGEPCLARLRAFEQTLGQPWVQRFEQIWHEEVSNGA